MSGSQNTFVGFNSGSKLMSGDFNTFIGALTGVASSASNIINSTAIGANTELAISNSIVLGNNASVGIGTNDPVTNGAKLVVVGAGNMGGGMLARLCALGWSVGVHDSDPQAQAQAVAAGAVPFESPMRAAQSLAPHGLLLVAVVDAVQTEVTRQLAQLPRKDIAAAALSHSRYILTADLTQAVAVTNAYAPEHLIVQTAADDELTAQFNSAASIFVGKWTPESAGDYASGTNHTLPTNGYARVYGGVSLDSFVKKVTYQKISEKGIKNLGPVIETMAAAEQLVAHKNAVSIRLKSKS